MDQLPGEKTKLTEFEPHVVHLRSIEFNGNPPSLSAFPEWVWYTPAPACLWGGLDNVVLSGIQTELGLEYQQAVFNVQLFDGFQNKEGDYWNRTLWAVEQTGWAKLKTEILNVTNVNSSEGLLIKYGLQILDIVDPIAAQNASVVTTDTPKVRVFCFGVMTNRYTIAVKQSPDVGSYPKPLRLKPEPGMITLAAQTLVEGADLGETARKFENLRIEGSDSRYDNL